MDEDDRGIEAYREALVAEAELARADLDEIEDHLRLLAADLERGGLVRAEAIAEACRRMGDPRAVGREHARVRSPFGAKLPRLRAWSAVLLLAPWWLDFARLTLGHRGPGLASMFGVNLVISTIALCGLVARASWARAILVGALSWFLLDHAIAVAWHAPWFPGEVWRVACLTGALVFVAPWRRGELARAGLVIALLAWAHHGVCVLATYELARPSQLPFTDPAGSIAFLATLLAGVGALVRARWAALAAAVAAVSLAIGCFELPVLLATFDDPTLWKIQNIGGIGAGAIAAAVAATLAWRARSTFGTLRHVVD